MTKIADLTVGQNVQIDLLVKSAEIKFTRPPGNKPYLFVELTDGSDVIKGQDWDWGNSPAPNKNDIFVVHGKVGEYMGNKQLSISRLSGSEKSEADFIPTGDVNVSEYSTKLKVLIESIGNYEAKHLVRSILNDRLKDFKQLPAAKGMHHAYVSGLLQHTVDVAFKAVALGQLVPNANLDLIKTGAILHDIGKLDTYFLNGAVIDMTDQGMFIEHIMLGAMLIDKYRTEQNSDIVDLVLHIVSSHHGELEYGSPTTPRCLEAVIVHFADNVDAKCQMINELVDKTKPEEKWTDKLWPLGNKPVLNPAYIKGVFEDGNES